MQKILRFAIPLTILALGVLSGNAKADVPCEAQCELSYEACLQSCNGRIVCQANCRTADRDCIYFCGNSG